VFGSLRLEIDPLRLEEEWQQHPSQYGYWAEKAVDAQDEMDRAKAAFEKTASQIDSELRESPDDFGIKKATEAEVKTALVRQPGYVRSQEAYLAAKKEYNLTQAALASLEHRKRALSMLVELFVKDYYSDMQKHAGGGDDDKRHVRRRALDRGEKDA
jgi:hypothetical protein